MKIWAISKQKGAEYEIGHGFGPVKHFWALWKE